jgi:integrase
VKQETRPQTLSDAFVKNYNNNTSKRVEIRDAKVSGLVLRITSTNTKTFSLQTRMPNGEKLRISIGKYPFVGLKDARIAAHEHLVAISKGEDPREEKRKKVAEAEASLLTLRELLDEAETEFGRTRRMWQRNGRRDRSRPEARAAIENVFAALLDKPLTVATLSDFSIATKNYKPRKPKKGKKTANGASSRALSYLRTVFDWAAGRGRYKKENAGRQQKLCLPDLSSIHDPSIDDPTLEFERTRVLSQDELTAILPLLTHPAPPGLRAKVDPTKDYGPVAYRFMLLTLSRVEEVESARKKDFNLQLGLWTKSVKTRRKPGSRQAVARRLVTIPLSRDAIALISSLPSFADGRPDSFVFPSSNGGPYRNWDRTNKAILTASDTKAWHRHDLRRTSSTILGKLGIMPSIIDRLLCHVNPLKAENVSSAAVHYIIDEKILKVDDEPDREAVEKLAAALRSICAVASEVCCGDGRVDAVVTSDRGRSPSPWIIK